jgi:hypothetical protein
MAKLTRSSRRKDSALLMKFRVIPRVRMTRSHMFRLLDQFVSTGVVPKDIDVESADYAHGIGKRWIGGERYRDISDITKMINAFKAATDVRFEKVD